MDKWSFYNPTQIEFSNKSIELVGNIVGYNRIILITTPGFTKRGIVNQLKKTLGIRLIKIFNEVKPNPDIEYIDATAKLLRPYDPDCLIGLGGGSSLDTAKALSYIIPMQENITLTSKFRLGFSLKKEKTLPVITIPTTSGTGAEVTPFATIWDFQMKKKYSLSGDDLFPIKAFLDPSLTLGLPENLTISSGLDAISHAFESIWNKNANPVSIGLATQSLTISLKSLPQLKKNPKSLDERMAMMEASLLAGMSISQTRTALAHSISYPLTLEFNIPHGIACSFTLPALLDYNAEVDDGRLHQLASSLGYKDVDKLFEVLKLLFLKLEVPKYYSSYISDDEQVLEYTKDMLTPGRADNNLRSVSLEDVTNIIKNSHKIMNNLNEDITFNN